MIDLSRIYQERIRDLASLDKRDRKFEIRIPDCAKEELDSLPGPARETLTYLIILLIDDFIHQSKYKPGMYFRENNKGKDK